MQHVWEGLLHLKKVVEQYPNPIQFCSFNLEAGTVRINEVGPNTSKEILLVLEKVDWSFPANQLVFYLQSLSKLELVQKVAIAEDRLLFLKKYLPYCFLSIAARQQKKAIIIAHFAQTLDGKIATQNGDSKWIGNQENLLHAHRMRALCQGILVGSRTVEKDNPRLTVRLVKGANPIRIIIGHPSNDFESLLQIAETPIWVLHTRPISKVKGVIYHQLPVAPNGKIDTNAIVQFLYQQGVDSVYMEGGALTSSYFLETGQIAVLQFHIAPLLFGSGTNGIQLPSINKVAEAIQFKQTSFLSFGDGVMFTGDLTDRK